MSVVVRRIEPTEGARLKQIRLAALRDAPAAFGSTFEVEVRLDDIDWTKRARAGASGSERATFFALEGDDVVGLVGGYRADGLGADVELVSMWTSPGVRRQGVGRVLVGAVLEWAAASGAESVALWVTRGNDPAHGLYESVGFQTTGEHQPLPSDPCKDEVRMILRT